MTSTTVRINEKLFKTIEAMAERDRRSIQATLEILVEKGLKGAPSKK